MSYRVPSRGGWQKWTTFPGAAEFSAGNQPVTLRLPKHGSADYRGALRSVEKHTVNVLPIDRYVQGVVPREVPAEWPAEAVRAQAVAARTYAAFEREPATSYYDICDTESCQVYGGVDGRAPGGQRRGEGHGGRVVLYQGQPAFTQFSSSNGGYSSAGSQPYLAAQPDPYEASSDNPNDPWTATVTSAQIEKAWPVVSKLVSLSFSRDGLGAHFGGRVTSVTAHRQPGRPAHLGQGHRRRLPVPAAGSSRPGSSWRRPDARKPSTSTRSPPSTAWVPEIASRSTVPSTGRGDRGLHLHRLDGGHHLAGRDLVALGDGGGHHALERRGDLSRLRGVGLLGRGHLRGDRAVADADRPQLPVDGGHDVPIATLVGLADRLQPEDDRLALLELTSCSSPCAQPVEVVDRRQHRDVAVGLARLQELAGRAGEQQLVERRPAGPRAALGQRRRLLGGELAGRRLPACGPRAPWSGTAPATRRAGRPARR